MIILTVTILIAILSILSKLYLDKKYEYSYHDSNVDAVLFISTIFSIGTLILLTILIPVCRYESNIEVEQFKATKILVEENYHKHDFENANLIQSVIDANNKLILMKTSRSSKMLNIFNSPKIMELEPITIPER